MTTHLPSVSLDLSGLQASCHTYPDRSPILGASTERWHLSLTLDSDDLKEHLRAAARLLAAAEKFSVATAAWVASQAAKSLDDE